MPGGPALDCPAVTGPTWLDWPDCLNVRDLGGLPAGSGGTTRPGALIRSDNHTRLTAAGIRAVRGAGVSRIVDLRAPREWGAHPSPFGSDPVYRNCTLERDDSAYDPARSLEANYLVWLDRCAELFAAAVGAVADAPPGAVVVHCNAGKDRAGMVAALSLRLVGVPAGVVAADYATLGPGLRESFDRDLAALDDPDARARAAEELAADPDTMHAVLAHLQSRYGGVEPYLRGAGLTGTQVAALRERLTARP